MTARLRIRFPSHVEVTGRNATGNKIKIKEVEIPLMFTSPKGPTSAAFIELIADGRTAGDTAPVELGVGDHILLVSGKDGRVTIQSSRNDFVEPAFLATLGKNKVVAEGDDEGDDDDVVDDAADDDDDDDEAEDDADDDEDEENP